MAWELQKIPISRFKFWIESIKIQRAGFNISNIGPRLKYDEGGQMDFIPTNLRLGSGLDLIFDASNILGVYMEFSKLLVPTPVAFYDGGNNFIGYRQPDVNFLNGIFNQINFEKNN